MIIESIEILKNSSPILVALIGTAIGFQHAFEPDHLSAVSTQLIKRKEIGKISLGVFVRHSLKSSILGVIWGAGHTTTILLIGILVALFSLTIPENLFNVFEIGVGIMLLYLAIRLIMQNNHFKMHIHPHTHENSVTHIHPHTHDDEHKHSHRSYLIGCIHGIAGSGGIVILVSSTLSSFDSSLSFILLFCLGSMIGMSLASGLLGIPLLIWQKKPNVCKFLRYSICVITIVIGISIISEIILGQKFFMF